MELAQNNVGVQLYFERCHSTADKRVGVVVVVHADGIGLGAEQKRKPAVK